MPETGLIALSAGDYRLVLEPARGGSVARFAWHNEPLFRETCGPGILDTACFPLVPFCNRIAHGRFAWQGRSITLAPNFPGSDHPHPLHGFGWLDRWDVVECSTTRAVLRHSHRAGPWPWDYTAEQVFILTEHGLRHELSVCNTGETPMPAGLGFHPYFPRDDETRYHSLHTGEWQTADEGLPFALHSGAKAIDWWHGQPVASRCVDTVYAGRHGPMHIVWPRRHLSLTIAPCDGLPLTVVYIPAKADFFCVEPVSHATDAVNREPGMGALNGGETLSVAVHYRGSRNIFPKSSGGHVASRPGQRCDP
jgi:aldose 1-epimerase